MNYYTVALMSTFVGLCLGVWLAFGLIRLGEFIRNRNEVKTTGEFYDNVR